MTLFWKDLKKKVKNEFIGHVQEVDSDSELENDEIEDPEKESIHKKSGESDKN
jgi:hypothetical protein